MVSRGWKQPFHQARRLLARLWLKLYPQVMVIGVTGSYGKTNTACAISAVLDQKALTLQTDLNLDTIYNLPMTILKLRPQHRFLVLEMGVDHRGEMDSYLELVKPSIGVVTGISPVHSEPELLGSIEGIIQEKGRLLESLPEDGWAILNRDDLYVREMAVKTKAQVLWCGIKEKGDFWAEEIKVGLDGTSFLLHAEKIKKQPLKLKISLIGRHFIHAALAAVAVGWTQGLGEEEILAGLGELRPLWGRLSVEKGPVGTILLDDHLRANPASTIAGLETLNVLPHRGRKIAILGEMGELGQYAEREHRRIGQYLVGLEIDFFLGVGPLQKLTVEEALKAGMSSQKVFWAKDVSGAAKILEKIIKKGDLLYLKGSLFRHLERIILLLGGKKMNCNVISCHFYKPCQGCPDLQKKI